MAANLIDRARLQLDAQRWFVEVRTGCEVEADGNVFVAGRALVRDEAGRVRAFAEHAGTEDSAATWKYYYDERSLLRVALFSWGSYRGDKANGVMAFGDAGQFVRCTSLPGDSGGIFCGSKDEDEPLEPEVAAVTTAPAPQPSGSIAWVMARDRSLNFRSVRHSMSRRRSIKQT